MKDENLLEFLLNHVRIRPAMYLMNNKITNLANFIDGYLFSTYINKIQDPYFSNPGFITWGEKTKGWERTSIWHSQFLREANDDEVLALEIFFKYLEEYSKTIE